MSAKQLLSNRKVVVMRQGSYIKLGTVGKMHVGDFGFIKPSALIITSNYECYVLPSTRTHPLDHHKAFKVTRTEQGCTIEFVGGNKEWKWDNFSIHRSGPRAIPVTQILFWGKKFKHFSDELFVLTLERMKAKTSGWIDETAIFDRDKIAVYAHPSAEVHAQPKANYCEVQRLHNGFLIRLDNQSAWQPLLI